MATYFPWRSGALLRHGIDLLKQRAPDWKNWSTNSNAQEREAGKKEIDSAHWSHTSYLSS